MRFLGERGVAGALQRAVSVYLERLLSYGTAIPGWCAGLWVAGISLSVVDAPWKNRAQVAAVMARPPSHEKLSSRARRLWNSSQLQGGEDDRENFLSAIQGCYGELRGMRAQVEAAMAMPPSHERVSRRSRRLGELKSAAGRWDDRERFLPASQGHTVEKLVAFLCRPRELGDSGLLREEGTTANIFLLEARLPERAWVARGGRGGRAKSLKKEWCSYWDTGVLQLA